MNMTTSRPSIAEHPFVKGMSPEHLEIAGCNAIEKTFQSGEVLFREGAFAKDFYLIESGRVALESHSPGGKTTEIQIVGANDVLGWSWLFPPFCWHFGARVIDQTRAIVLNAGRLLTTAEANHAFGYELQTRIAQIVIGRLQATRKQLVEESRRRNVSLTLETPGQGSKVSAGAPESLAARMASHPFLVSMKSDHLKVLEDLTMAVKFPAGEFVFAEGDLANRFYLIEQGKVSVESSVPDRDAVPIQILRDGDVLGWSWLFPPYRWHFDARALEDTQAIFLYGTRLRQQCEEDPDLGYDLMKRVTQVLIQRLQSTRRQLVQLKGP